MMSIVKKAAPLCITVFAVIVFTSPLTQVYAQGLNNQAWNPGPQSNRASIAALMKQVEDGGSGSSTAALVGSGGGDVTQLICGSSSGDSPSASSNAQANSSCIILNNSTGALNIDQDSDGDQDASTDNTETVSVDETINNAGGADEVLETLGLD